MKIIESLLTTSEATGISPDGLFSLGFLVWGVLFFLFGFFIHKVLS